MEGLPPVLADLSEIIGLGAALRLAEAFGGTEIYVPRDPPADHPVTQAIGLEAAQRLAQYLGTLTSGGRIDVPKGDALSRARRNRAIVEAVAAGASKQQLARTHGLTTRWVRSVCNGTRDDRQPDLFD
jgi:Mor family transcriptional regulator